MAAIVCKMTAKIMNFSNISLLLLAVFLVDYVVGESMKTVQIGIKKRVENCKIKSKRGDLLQMLYVGRLEDGTEFDRKNPGEEPFEFTLGSGQVIRGWDQGLVGMCEGEKRKLVIPPHLGYGESGAPPRIPGGATLVFEVDLVKIIRKDDDRNEF